MGASDLARHFTSYIVTLEIQPQFDLLRNVTALSHKRAILASRFPQQAYATKNNVRSPIVGKSFELNPICQMPVIACLAVARIFTAALYM